MASHPWAHLRGPALLIKWREAKKYTQQEVADLIDSDLARYNAFENGRLRPGLDNANHIARITEGRVPADSWSECKPRGKCAS